MNGETDLKGFLDEMLEELIRAKKLHPTKWELYHTGHSIMLEEFEEFWDEIKKKNPSKAKIKEELIQLGAMCIRFYMELLRE